MYLIYEWGKITLQNKNSAVSFHKNSLSLLLTIKRAIRKESESKRKLYLDAIK
jgi:hypothetical protein